MPAGGCPMGAPISPFPPLAHAQVYIKVWRQNLSAERPGAGAAPVIPASHMSVECWADNESIELCPPRHA